MQLREKVYLDDFEPKIDLVSTYIAAKHHITILSRLPSILSVYHNPLAEQISGLNLVFWEMANDT
jgi:hypothetical protein